MNGFLKRPWLVSAMKTLLRSFPLSVSSCPNMRTIGEGACPLDYAATFIEPIGICQAGVDDMSGVSRRNERALLTDAGHHVPRRIGPLRWAKCRA